MFSFFVMVLEIRGNKYDIHLVAFHGIFVYWNEFLFHLEGLGNFHSVSNSKIILVE